MCSQPLLTLTNTSWIFNLTVEGIISRSNLNSQDPKCFSVTAQEITTLLTSHADRDCICSDRLAGEHNVPQPSIWSGFIQAVVLALQGSGFKLICHLKFYSPRTEKKKLYFFFLESLLNLLQDCFCFMFWFFGHEACGILVPHPGMELTSPVLEGKVLAPAPPGKSLGGS